MKHLSRAFYGPPNWLVRKFSVEDRRAFGFWVVVFAIIGLPFFGAITFYVSILSVLALIPNYTTETPVENEGSTKANSSSASSDDKGDKK